MCRKSGVNLVPFGAARGERAVLADALAELGAVLRPVELWLTARRRRPKTKKGNLSKAQVKHRTKVAEGYGVAFIAIEIIIVMTGSGSAWIHLVSMLPGMMMMVAGVTASFST